MILPNVINARRETLAERLMRQRLPVTATKLAESHLQLPKVTAEEREANFVHLREPE